MYRTYIYTQTLTPYCYVMNNITKGRQQFHEYGNMELTELRKVPNPNYKWPLKSNLPTFFDLCDKLNQIQTKTWTGGCQEWKI